MIRRFFEAFLIPSLLALLATCGEPREVQTGEPAELEPVRVTVFGERVLLFMEHPRLIRGEPARFLVHLSVLETGEPVRSGSVRLDLGPASLAAGAPKRDGLFVPEGLPAQAGELTARVHVQSPQVEEMLELGRWVVHATPEEARAASQAAEAEAPSGGVPFLMEQQWKVKLLLAEAGPRTLTRRLIAPALVRAPEGAEVVVTPPLAGRLLAPAGAPLARTGEVVRAQQVLGWIEPPLGAADVAQLQALRLELDLRSLDVERALGEATARLAFAERERERIAKLREATLSTAQELDEAERNLALARAEEQGARAAKQSLETLRTGRPDDAGLAGYRFALVSPLSGTVLVASRLAGESVEAGEAVFRILDTSRVWIEARVSELDLPLVGASATGSVTLAALPGRRFEAEGGLRVHPTVDPLTHAALVRCELANDDGALRPGMMAELEIATGSVAAAVALPLEAVLSEQGLATAYVMLEGELFQRRELELGTRDGAWVEILGGIAPGERVAARGANLVKLAASSPASFGAGHQH